MVAGPNAVKYMKSLKTHAEDMDFIAIFDAAVKEEQEKWDNTLKMDGTENAYVLHKELGEWMTDNVTVVRYNDRLEETDKKILELLERYENINMTIHNYGLTKVHHLHVS